MNDLVPEVYANLIRRQLQADLLTDRLLGSIEERKARAAKARGDRAAVRGMAAVTDLSLDRLLLRFGWSEEYARHLVQPYCECGPDIDAGWFVCSHARDLDLHDLA